MRDRSPPGARAAGQLGMMLYVPVLPPEGSRVPWSGTVRGSRWPLASREVFSRSANRPWEERPEYALEARTRSHLLRSARPVQAGRPAAPDLWSPTSRSTRMFRADPGLRRLRPEVGLDGVAHGNMPTDQRASAPSGPPSRIGDRGGQGTPGMPAATIASAQGRSPPRDAPGPRGHLSQAISALCVLACGRTAPVLRQWLAFWILACRRSRSEQCWSANRPLRMAGPLDHGRPRCRKGGAEPRARWPIALVRPSAFRSP